MTNIKPENATVGAAGIVLKFMAIAPDVVKATELALVHVNEVLATCSKLNAADLVEYYQSVKARLQEGG
jgi:hypothetical protein